MSKSPITIRMETSLLAAARQQAGVENRTLTNNIETLLMQALASSSATASTMEVTHPLPSSITPQSIQIPAAISTPAEALVEAKEA